MRLFSRIYAGSLTIRLVIYYASNVFISLGLNSGTIALLATGVTGVVFFVSTLPAMVRSVLMNIKIAVC